MECRIRPSFHDLSFSLVEVNSVKTLKEQQKREVLVEAETAEAGVKIVVVVVVVGVVMVVVVDVVVVVVVVVACMNYEGGRTFPMRSLNNWTFWHFFSVNDHAMAMNTMLAICIMTLLLA